MNQVGQPDHQERENVNLHEFFRDAWAARKAVLYAVTIVTVIYMGFFASKLFFYPPTFTHSLIIDFKFNGAEKGQYPNQSPFSISDLIAPKLLAEVYALSGLSKREMSKPKFMHNFRIVPHLPNYEIIQKKYEDLILYRGQSVQIETLRKLQEDMKKELSQLQTRAAVLSFRSKWRAINQETVESLLLGVPKHWADKMINEYGVLELDAKMYSKDLFDEYQYEDLDYLVAIDKVQANINLVAASITELLEFPNSQRVTDKKTGYNLLDLQKLVQDILLYDLNRLSSFIQELGISSDAATVKLYYEHQINKLEISKAYQLEQAELINQTLRDYIQKLGSADDTRVVRENTVDMVQASGDFLDRITELVKQSEDLDYRQNLHDHYIQYKQEAAKIDYEIAQKRALLNALNKKSEIYKTFGDNYEKTMMHDHFPQVLSKMREYMDVLNRIHDALSKENFGQDTKLYRISNVAAMKTTGVRMSSWDKATFGLLVFGTAFGTLVVTVIVRSQRKSD